MIVNEDGRHTGSWIHKPRHRRMHWTFVAMCINIIPHPKPSCAVLDLRLCRMKSFALYICTSNRSERGVSFDLLKKTMFFQIHTFRKYGKSPSHPHPGFPRSSHRSLSPFAARSNTMPLTTVPPPTTRAAKTGDVRLLMCFWGVLIKGHRYSVLPPWLSM